MRTTIEEGRRVVQPAQRGDFGFGQLSSAIRRTTHRAVALVLTANPTFGRGPRGELCQWLLKERQALAR
jgi:hypothetical protein